MQLLRFQNGLLIPFKHLNVCLQLHIHAGISVNKSLLVK